MIGVLTYDAPHRKTQDLLLQLRARGHDGVVVVATPWKERKSFRPLIPHRPSDALPIPCEELARNLGFDFRPTTIERLPDLLSKVKPRVLLIGGAGILPAEVIESRRIVNSHPGLLPYVRGLDALKWAIYDDLPIGVTTHLISEEADAGFLLDRREVPIHPWDTFHSLAYRQFAMEISMLAEAADDVRDAAELPVLDPEEHPVHRRMPHRKERELLERFQERVRRVAGELGGG